MLKNGMEWINTCIVSYKKIWKEILLSFESTIAYQTK